MKHYKLFSDIAQTFQIVHKNGTQNYLSHSVQGTIRGMERQQ